MPFTYDFPRPSVTVDIALITIEPAPRILLIRRKHPPFAGDWALPGGFVDADEALDAAARRELREETAVSGVELKQFMAFGDPARDPRGWTISIVFVGRTQAEAVKPRAADDAEAVAWHALNSLPVLAFDHGKIVEQIMKRLTANPIDS